MVYYKNMHKDTKTITFEEMEAKALKNPKFKKAYDDLGPEFDIIEQILKKRIEKHITQKQLAKRLCTNQSAVSRLESGTYNPSLKFMKKLAKALKSKLEIRFV